MIKTFNVAGCEIDFFATLLQGGWPSRGNRHRDSLTRAMSPCEAFMLSLIDNQSEAKVST